LFFFFFPTKTKKNPHFSHIKSRRIYEVADSEIG
jgi:hypothetical protein